MSAVDVTVFGAGIFGLSIAEACLERGASVRVIDPTGPGAGASGGIVGALAPHVPENWNPKKAFQLQSLLAARSYWPRIEAQSGLATGYGATGRLQPLADEAAMARARARGAEANALWQGQARWDVIPARSAGPFAPPSASGWLVFDTLSARIDPARACAALARAIIRAGGEIASEGRAEGRVLDATGWHGLRRFSRETGRPVGDGVKGQALRLAVDARNAPQIFADGLHLVPHADGTLAVGSTSERNFTSPDTTDAHCDALLARASALMPALAGAREIARWAGVRPRAVTRAPLLGRMPGSETFVANGGFKIGFGLVPGVGELMSALMLDGDDRIPAHFRPEAVFGPAHQDHTPPPVDAVKDPPEAKRGPRSEAGDRRRRKAP